MTASKQTATTKPAEDQAELLALLKKSTVAMFGFKEPLSAQQSMLVDGANVVRLELDRITSVVLAGGDCDLKRYFALTEALKALMPTPHDTEANERADEIARGELLKVVTGVQNQKTAERVPLFERLSAAVEKQDVFACLLVVLEILHREGISDESIEACRGFAMLPPQTSVHTEAVEPYFDSDDPPPGSTVKTVYIDNDCIEPPPRAGVPYVAVQSNNCRPGAAKPPEDQGWRGHHDGGINTAPRSADSWSPRKGF